MEICKFEELLEIPENLCGWPGACILSSAATFCLALKQDKFIDKVITQSAIYNVLYNYLRLHWAKDSGLEWLTKDKALKIWDLCDTVDYKYVEDQNE